MSPSLNLLIIDHFFLTVKALKPAGPSHQTVADGGVERAD